MFDFIVKNSSYVDEFIYMLCGIVCFLTAHRSFTRKNKNKFTSGVFWIILGICFAFGGLIIKNFTNGGIIVGIMLVIMGIISIFNKVTPSEFEEVSDQIKENNAKKVGFKIFIPALVMGISAMILSQLKSFNIVLASGEVFALSSAQTLAISSILALVCGWIIARPKVNETIDDTTKMVMQVGVSSLLPQLLGGLGVVFTSAGVGVLIGNIATGIISDAGRLAGVVAYVVGMVVFTMIMGNAFAAFTVITLGIGIPFVINNGANPAVVASLGMTAGYCGTLITPMAANFNIVPAAVLETKNKYTVIKAQLPVALAMVIVHIVLMMVLAY